MPSTCAATATTERALARQLGRYYDLERRAAAPDRPAARRLRSRARSRPSVAPGSVWLRLARFVQQRALDPAVYVAWCLDRALPDPPPEPVQLLDATLVAEFVASRPAARRSAAAALHVQHQQFRTAMRELRAPRPAKPPPTAERRC